MLDQGPTVLSSISHLSASLSGQFSHEVTRWPPGAPGFDSPSLTTPEDRCASLLVGPAAVPRKPLIGLVWVMCPSLNK